MVNVAETADSRTSEQKTRLAVETLAHARHHSAEHIMIQ